MPNSTNHQIRVNHKSQYWNWLHRSFFPGVKTIELPQIQLQTAVSFKPRHQCSTCPKSKRPGHPQSFYWTGLGPIRILWNDRVRLPRPPVEGMRDRGAQCRANHPFDALRMAPFWNDELTTTILYRLYLLLFPWRCPTFRCQAARWKGMEMLE